MRKIVALVLALGLAGCGAPSTVHGVVPPRATTTTAPATTTTTVVLGGVEPPCVVWLYSDPQLPDPLPAQAFYIGVWSRADIQRVTRKACEQFGNPVPPCVQPTFDQCIRP